MTKSLCLFDLDGTLTVPRNIITEEMETFLKELSKVVDLAIVSGSDINKIKEQLNNNTKYFSYVCSENGTVIHKGETLVKSNSIQEKLGEDFLQEIINFILYKFSQMKLPIKRGNFVEFRQGMINISPIGRSCSQKERNEFAKFDQEHKIREKLVKELKEEFGEERLTYSIGGQISIDIFPAGWDKRHCLEFICPLYEKIIFFGDKTEIGGNDYEIFQDDRTIGVSVEDHHFTMKKLKEMFY